MKMVTSYCTAGNFQGKRCLQISSIFYSAKLRGVASVGSTSKQSVKVFSLKIVFPPIHKSFLSQKIISLYGLRLYDSELCNLHNVTKMYHVNHP